MQDLRHVTSINDLTMTEIEAIFSLAQKYLRELGDPNLAHRIGRSINDAQGSVLACLFYEPSTRTRLSFESAMLRLGGKTMGTDNAREFSSAAKGETLEDTVRIVGGYADVIVLRHPDEGAAKRAAAVSTVPIINAGDGPGQHPTQALLDLYTIKDELNRIDGIKVALVGD